jgi:hypothetical protein
VHFSSSPLGESGPDNNLTVKSVEFESSIILRIRRQRPKSNDPQPTIFDDEKPLADQVAVMLDENPPADQVVDVQGQESVMEEISSQ